MSNNKHMICTCVTSEALDIFGPRTLGSTKGASSSDSLESDTSEDEDKEVTRVCLTHRASSSSSSDCLEVKLVVACFQQVPDLEILLRWFMISINRIDRSPAALAVFSLYSLQNESGNCFCSLIITDLSIKQFGSST